MAIAVHLETHLRAMGPQTEAEILRWAETQLTKNKRLVLTVLASNPRLTSYQEEGRTYWTMKDQNPS